MLDTSMFSPLLPSSTRGTVLQASLAPGGLRQYVQEIPLHEEENLDNNVMKVIEERYSKSTWIQRRAIVRGFLYYCLREKGRVSPIYIPSYLESKVIKPSSKIQYAKMLTSVLMGDEPLFQTYIKGLHRIQARQPIRHAVAMSVEDMRSLIRLFPSWEEKTVLRLAWMTASRWSDIQYLTTDHFVELHPLLVLDWWTAPKSSKLVPDRPYRYHRFPGKFAADLRKLIAQLGPGSRLTNISMARLTRAMRMLGTRRDHLQQKRYYTAHSMKRGAVQLAARLANEADMDPHTVVRLAKHKDLGDIPATTIRYLGPFSVFLSTTDKLTALLADSLMK
eukprot:gene7705-biopygen4814